MKICLPVSTSNTQYYINQAYVDYLVESGFTPFLLTPGQDPEKVARECDGLLLPGGGDLDPIYYGNDNFTSYKVDPEKDEFERAALYSFIGEKKPIFGICRGFQLLINEYLEENSQLYELVDFWTHVSKHNQQNEQQLSRQICQHYVKYFPARLYGAKRKKSEYMPVNSMHHQCLVFDFGKEKISKQIGGFKIAAWTDRGLPESKDKQANPQICEAFQIMNWGGPILAVQWHPEELRDYALIQNFFLPENEEAPAEAGV
jgi:putative glutamine amidotransferase